MERGVMECVDRSGDRFPGRFVVGVVGVCVCQECVGSWNIGEGYALIGRVDEISHEALQQFPVSHGWLVVSSCEAVCIKLKVGPR